MDFHSLMRRDLQFLCKRNKIPANMTNVAMADALKALEIVEGLNEYMNSSDSNAPHSPTSVARQPPNTATRTTRRKTAIKAEPQCLSQLVNPSSHLTRKSLAGEMDQEPKTNNVKFEVSVAKTPAARSTRKATAATSCSSKVQESKKGELVQSVYSTRRSTRLLEKCMGDLSLNTKETGQKESAQDKNPAGSSEEKSEEAEVIPGRDLSASMEKEWKMLKNDSDEIVGDLELYVDIGDTAVLDANTETNNDKMNEVLSDEKESENGLTQADKQDESLEAMSEEGSKKNVNDQEIGGVEISIDLGDISVLECANSDLEESKNVEAFDSLVQVDQQETEEVIEEKSSEREKTNNFDIVVDQMDGDGADSETKPEEDNVGIDSDDIISEADSNQAVFGSDIADEEMILSESKDYSPPARIATPLSLPIAVQFPRPNKSTTPLKKSGVKLVNVDNKENSMEMMMMDVNNNENGESKVEEVKKKKKVENLENVSMRQLVKMVKELSIKSSNNRTALQTLRGNNQIAE